MCKMRAQMSVYMYYSDMMCVLNVARGCEICMRVR